MPSTPGGICRSCSRRQVPGTKYCDQHQDSSNEHKRQYDRYRKDDPIRKLYKSRRWLKGTRLIVLRRDILCRSCGHEVATEVDHILSARLVIDNFGIDAFYDPERCQGLCHNCHSAKTSHESGWVNRTGTKLTDLGDRSNTTVVCGQAGSGKTTYVAEHKADDDLVWDYDVVMHEITGLPMHQGLQGAIGSVLANRDQWVHPSAAIGYSGVATVLYEPMDLGVAGEPQENRFEVITPGIYGGVYANGTTILDCNPVYCMNQVLTNSMWGLGVGAIPFPTAFIDNGAGGTWGSAGTPGVQSVNSTAWNWFASNSFFISPTLDSQDTAASALSKWLEAGMCAAFVSEGLLKLVPYGDTTQAANGCTWTAPSEYIAALDDTCFIAKDGQDPVSIKRSAWQDAYNTVQVQWNNRNNQYAPEITQESDQSLIDRFGSRIEDPQSWDFIHTLTAATVAANLRLKHGTYIRNTYEFTLPYTYSFLEPMDIVTLTTSSVWAAGINNTNLGVTNLPIRILKIVDDPVEGLKIEAEDYPFGAGVATLFNKGQAAAEVVSDTYASPGSSEVVMFEASGRLVGYSGNQIWIGACGTSANYGSTNVWVSQDNVNFVQVETINQPAVIGELASAFPAASDPDTTNSLVVALAENSAALVSGTQAAADNDTMLCYVNGEVISYSAASLTGQNTYTIGTYIRRGQLGTTIGSHAAGSLFMRLDGSIVKYTYDPTWQGKTIYFKFQAVNNFDNNPQPLSSLSSVSFTIGNTNSGAVDASSGLLVTGTPGYSVSAIDGTVNVLQGNSGINNIPPGYVLINNTGNPGAPTWVDPSTVPGLSGGGSGGGFTVVKVSSDFDAEDGQAILVTTTSGNITGTLPPAASNANAEIVVKKVSADANTVTLQGTGGDTIDGDSSLTIMYQHSSCTLISDGSGNWDLI